MVILQIVLQKVVTQSRQKQTRPRTPSRGPKRRGPSGRGGRRVFGPNDSKKVGEERSGGYRSGPHESQKCEGTAPGDEAFSLAGTSSFDRQVQGSGGRLDLDVQFGSSFSPNVSDKIREDPPGKKVQTNSFGESGEVGVSPTIPFGLEPAGLQPDFSQEVEQGEDQMRAEWQRVVSHVVEVNRTYHKLDRVFSLDGMSWVAVHEQYMPFFPPQFGNGGVFELGEWVSTRLKPLPQELSAFQAQWAKWNLGQVGFDRRTNVLMQVLETDCFGTGFWKAQLISGDICFLAVHRDYQEWGTVSTGDWLVAFQVVQIGCFQGAALSPKLVQVHPWSNDGQAISKKRHPFPSSSSSQASEGGIQGCPSWQNTQWLL